MAIVMVRIEKADRKVLHAMALDQDTTIPVILSQVLRAYLAQHAAPPSPPVLTPAQDQAALIDSVIHGTPWEPQEETTTTPDPILDACGLGR